MNMVQVTVYWKWGGNPSKLMYYPDDPLSRADLHRLLVDLKSGKADAKHYEIHELVRLPIDSALKKLDGYPTHDPS